jgi:hypothetical protein
MLPDLAPYINLLFGLIVIVTIIWIYIATKSKVLLLAMIGWSILQSFLAFSGVYQDTQSMPPRILIFGVLPVLIIIVGAFFNSQGKALMDRIDLKPLTYFHVIRIPVEIVLVLLYHHGYVSRYMTFEGTNFDLISGITAPIIAYVVFKTLPIKKDLLFVWNIFCLLLLLNVVITAVFALPTPFQKISFEQPNVAILYFPFNLLPTLVVPAVLFAHFVAIRRHWQQPK